MAGNKAVRMFIFTFGRQQAAMIRMMSEEISRSNCIESSGDEDEEFNGASPIGRTVVVKYKSRNPVSIERGAIASPLTPTSVKARCTEEDLIQQRPETCSPILRKV